MKTCSQAVPMLDYPIWRGMTFKGGAIKIDPRTGARQSQNTKNYYTTMIDNLPAWKNWPKRSKSLICANDAAEYNAEGYGDLYAIFPVNGARVAICPDLDIWGTMVTSYLVPKTKEAKEALTDSGLTKPEMRANVLDLNDVYYQLGIPDNYAGFLKGCDHHFENGASAVTSMYTEMQSQFTLCSIEEYATKHAHNRRPHEVWTDGPVIALSRGTWSATNDMIEARFR